MRNVINNKVVNFFNNYPEINFGKNELVMKPGTKVNFVYYLEAGYVRQSSTTKSGEDLTIHIYQPGAFFPILYLIGESDSNFSFEAISDLTLKKAKADEVMNWLKHEPEIMFLLLQRFSRATLGLANRLQYLLSNDAYLKVVSLLIYLSSNFGVKTINGANRLEPTFTHEEMASWLGLARETVSRQVEKLKDKKIVTYEGHKLIVLNDVKLEQELG